LNLPRALGRELVLGGHLLALGTASMAACASILMGQTPTIPLLVMAYLFSFGAYMLNRTSDIDEDSVSNPGRTTFLSGRKRYLPVIAAGSFVLGYALAAMRNAVFFTALLLPLLLALGYSVGSKRLAKLTGARRLKDALLVKNAAISFGWSLVPILVGLYFLAVPLLLYALGIFIFLRLLVNTILFDVRDTEGDKMFGVRTVPTVYGEGRAFTLMATFDSLSAVVLVLLVLAGALPLYALVLLVFNAYSFCYRAIARRPGVNLSLVCDLIADSEYLLWGPVIYIGKLLI
jgi:4-hydroxybenzoate polyprenyltransferase